MTGDIIDTIDGACDDWVTSADAMRWRPASAPPHARHQSAPSIVRTGWTPSGVILDEVAETLASGVTGIAEAFEVAREVAREHLDRIAKVFRDAAAQNADFSRLFGPQQATRDALSPRVPAYQDCRPRWQSPYGPARRR